MSSTRRDGGRGDASPDGRRSWRNLSGRRLHAAAWAAFALYLVTPTSLSLLLDGLPLSTRPELIAFLALAVAAFASGAIWLLGPAGAPARPAFPGAALAVPLVAGATLLVGLSALKLGYPRADAVALCLRSPEVPGAPCLWSPEARGPEGGRVLTRYEARVDFDESRGRPWRLGYLNTLDFNLYGQPPESPEGRRAALRRAGRSPFEASFPVGVALADLLERRYQAGDGTVAFKGRVRGVLSVTSGDVTYLSTPPDALLELRDFRFRVPRAAVAGLTWRYRSFDCPAGPPETCHRTMLFRTVPHRDAVLEARVVRPGRGRSDPLGPGDLRWRRGEIAPVVARGFESLALTLFAWGAVAAPVAALAWTALRWACRPGGLLSGGAGASLGAALVQCGLVYAGAAWAFIPARRYGVLLDPGISFWLTLPGAVCLLLAALQPRWRAALGVAGDALRGRVGLLLWLAPVCGYAAWATAEWSMRTDAATLMRVGEDNLTYASWAKDALREGRRILDPSMVLSKPAFPYLRALGYVVFGEGEEFLAVAVGVAFLVLYAWAAHAVFGICLGAIERCDRVPGRLAAVLAHGVVLLWFANAFLAYGAAWSTHLFSEGPAWFLFTVSVALLLPVLAEGRWDRRLVCAAGIAFGASLLFRSPLLLFAPVLAAALLLLRPASLATTRQVAGALGLPVVTAGALMAGHAALGAGEWRRIAGYVAANTSIRPGGSMLRPLDPGLGKLVPTREAAAQVAVFGTLLALTVVRRRRVAGRWTDPALLGMVGFGVVLVLCGFVLQIPLLAAPYYPRTIMPTYYFLILFLAVWLRRGMSRE